MKRQHPPHSLFWAGIDLAKATFEAALWGHEDFRAMRVRSFPRCVDGARALVTRLRELDGTPWSCGIVDWTDGETFDTAIVRADSLMYEDKARRQESPAP